MDASSLVALFGQEAGVPLALGASRTAALSFKEGPTVQIEHDPSHDALHCYVVIGRFPAEPERGMAMARLLLQANAFGRDTEGAVLSIDADEIVLSCCLELAYADTTALRAVIESLVAIGQDWQSRLNDTAPAASSSACSIRFPDPSMRA
jgi:hypothetical protein